MGLEEEIAAIQNPNVPKLKEAIRRRLNHTWKKPVAYDRRETTHYCGDDEKEEGIRRVADHHNMLSEELITIFLDNRKERDRLEKEAKEIKEKFGIEIDFTTYDDDGVNDGVYRINHCHVSREIWENKFVPPNLPEKVADFTLQTLAVLPYLKNLEEVLPIARLVLPEHEIPYELKKARSSKAHLKVTPKAVVPQWAEELGVEISDKKPVKLKEMQSKEGLIL